ncbi:MAG: class I adenylate-forming enzyme family protein [Rhodoferax sp.]
MLSFTEWSRDRICADPGADATPPLTLNFIRHWAEQTPQAQAVVVDGRPIQYVDLYRHLCGCVQAMAAFNLRPGQVVWLSVSDFYINLVVLIALETLGLTSAMASRRTQLNTDPLLRHADFALLDEAVEDVSGVPSHRMTATWLHSVFNQPHQGIEGLVHSPQWTDGVRLTSSSGTSQEPKPILLNHAVQASWHQYYLDYSGYTSNSRLLVVGSWAVNVFYSRATVCLRLGATVMSLKEVIQLPQLKFNTACMMPLDLEILLKLLPDNFIKPERLVIHTGGAALTAPLRARALQRLCTAIHNNYGCVETGVLIEMQEEKIGALAAGVKVDIVDQAHQPLPAGQLGVLRAKSKTMIEAYWHRPEATAQSFRDGWFYPGDEAMRLPDGRLQLMGRRDDLLNLGGIKTSPLPFEQALKELDWIQDAAFVAFRDVHAGERFGLALVLATNTPPESWKAMVLGVLQRLSSWIAMNDVKPLCVTLPSLPYTSTQKLRRQEIRDLFKNLKPAA